MWIMKDGSPCIMMQDTENRMQWVYIPEADWDAMTEEQKARYI